MYLEYLGGGQGGADFLAFVLPAGMFYKEKKAMTIQYHPESSPGPHDADICFEQVRLASSVERMKLLLHTRGTVGGQLRCCLCVECMTLTLGAALLICDAVHRHDEGREGALIP